MIVFIVFVGLCFIIVTIRDINNNAPVFSQNTYATSILGSQLGKSILRVEGSDADYGANGRVTFDIQESADSNL